MKKLNQHMEEIQSELKDFPWDNKEAYAEWLAQTHFFVKHSIRLLGLSIARFPDNAEGFRLRYCQHIKEEYGHERMCVSDLEEMGFDINDYSELPETKYFYRSQYYGVDHISPQYLLGYILFLEGIAVHGGRELYEMIQSMHEGPHTFLRVHVEEDPTHLDKAVAQVEALSLDEKEIVMESLELSAAGYRNLLKGIKEKLQAYEAAA